MLRRSSTSTPASRHSTWLSRSITRGPPRALRMDSGLNLISKVSQEFCANVNAAAGGADCPHSSRHGFR
jgi:hypothetical protein